MAVSHISMGQTPHASQVRSSLSSLKHGLDNLNDIFKAMELMKDGGSFTAYAVDKFGFADAAAAPVLPEAAVNLAFPTFGIEGLGAWGFQRGRGSAAPSNLLTYLVAAWEFEGSGNVGLDSHTNAVDLTNNNSVTVAAGLVGNAAQFVAASSQSLQKHTPTVLRTGGGDYAAAFWVYRDWSTSGGLAGIATLGLSDPEWGFDGRDNRYDMRHFDSGTRTLQGDNPTFHAWNFITGAYVGADGAKNMAVTATTLNAEDFYISHGLGGFTLLNGAMDSFFYWKGYNPTPTERTWLYNAGAGRSYAEVQAYTCQQIKWWDFLNRHWWLKGKRPPRPLVVGVLPRLPARLRGRPSRRLPDPERSRDGLLSPGVGGEGGERSEEHADDAVPARPGLRRHWHPECRLLRRGNAGHAARLRPLRMLHQDYGRYRRGRHGRG
jgi:hypothetical protein